MKNQSFLTICFCVFLNCSGQQSTSFEIRETVEDFDFKQTQKNLSQQKDSILLDDQLYRVRSTCSGEWGGSIWFKNKKTGIEYSCEATCPVVVNKLNNKYFITTTLAHGIGFSQIIEVTNPELMEVFVLPEPTEQEDGTFVRYVGDDESKSVKGRSSLTDSTGILTISSFPFKNELYHIITDFKKTYISKILDGQFSVIDTVSDKSIWTYNPEVIITEDGHYITFFWNDESKGYIDIWNNKIELKLLE